MKCWHDRKAQDDPDYQVGDKVYLEGTNLRVDRPTKKMGDRRYGPFEVLKKVGSVSYKLKIPASWRIKTPVFHASLLSPYNPPTFDNQKLPPPPPPDVIDGQQEWEIEEILDCRKVGRGY